MENMERVSAGISVLFVVSLCGGAAFASGKDVCGAYTDCAAYTTA